MFPRGKDMNLVGCKILPALILGHVFLELLEGGISGADFLEDDTCLIFVRLHDHVSVSPLHSESVELCHTLVSECDTCGHHSL